MTGFYLYDNQNSHSPERDNRLRFWGYSSRTKSIQGLVIHTAEALDQKLSDGDQTAENVARYLATTDRPASAHVVIDTDSTVELLPDDAVAFHCKGANSNSLGVEIAYKAHLWESDTNREDLLLRNTAAWCAAKALQFDIPVRRVGAIEWKRGEKGFIDHASMDPARRTDPGPKFPWALFLSLVKSNVAALAAPDSTRKPASANEEQANSAPLIRPPSRPAVESLQKSLTAIGFPIVADGLLGPKTLSAMDSALKFLKTVYPA